MLFAGSTVLRGQTSFTNTHYGGYTGGLGYYNNMFGYGTGVSIINPSNYNSFFGSWSGNKNTIGRANTFIGSWSGNKNTTGGSNVYVGYFSGSNNMTGSKNVFIGNFSGSGERGSNKLYIDNSGTSAPLIYGDFATNKVGINTNKVPTGFTFAVNGKAIATEMQLQAVANWPDYVFAKEYKLPSLQEVEKHIIAKGHLQNIPTTKEVAKNGIAVGEMNAKLLQKIEELTLYTIAQEKRIKKLEELFNNSKN